MMMEESLCVSINIIDEILSWNALEILSWDVLYVKDVLYVNNYNIDTDNTILDEKIICKSEENLWDNNRYNIYCHPNYYSDYTFYNKCKYCNNILLDEQKLIGYESESDSEDEDSRDGYNYKLCISCEPFYSYDYVPDEYSRWCECDSNGGHSGYDEYEWKYSKRRDIDISWWLSKRIESDNINERKKIYIFLKRRVDIIREDLAKVLFDPERYNKYINMNYNIITDEYEYE